MEISSVGPKYLSFNADLQQRKSKETVQYDKNPISRKGEVAKITLATFLAGIALSAKLLFELGTDYDLVSDIVGCAKGKEKPNNAVRATDDFLDRCTKNVPFNKKTLCKIGVAGSLLAATMAGLALLYTIFSAPKIAYKSKVNTFKNKKEMDVYIKSNRAEKELYTALSQKAKTSSAEEREKLKEQYAKMKIAKNDLPKLV